ncbi:hypothetical protein AB0A69_32060 [Streptomyces sp. NPDC045431]|uniref:hypothetical protein n=1 Tax=Streptomyces sp. NPDC045431 TaxID=3155613 RepID=UPI0033EC5126
MTGAARPRLKSLTRTTDQQHTATLPASVTAVGGQKDVGRKAVPSALSPEPHPGDGRYVVAFLRITAPGRGAVPTATSTCECGRNRSAVGQARVLALIEKHAAHRIVCPLRHPLEGRNAA